MTPAVKVAAATANLDELESPAVASHPLRVNCYFGREHGSQSRGYSGNRYERKESERFNPDKSGANRFGERKQTRETPAHRQASCAVRLTVLVERRVLRLRRVSAARHLLLQDHREDLHLGLRGYRARQMILGDWRVLCEAR